MKANFNRAALSDVLGLLTFVVPGRTPKPILQCLRITAGEKDVRICATDLEVGVNCLVCEVQVEQSGEIVVPADRLAAVVRESTDDILLIEAEEGVCKITGADSHFTIYGQEALVATDGRRLARSRVNLAASPSKEVTQTKIIVPAKAMGLLDKIGGSDEDMVSIKLVDNQVLMSCANVVVSSNLVEGNFPKYEDIIPTDYDKKLTLSRDATLSAVRRAALLTSDESRGIKLAVGDDRLVFSSRAPEAGDARIEMSVKYKGEPIEIGFNPQFLIDALRVVREPEFELEFGQQDRPGLMKSGQNFLYVLMPVSLG